MSSAVTRKRAISIGWVVAFAFLLGLTLWLASSARVSPVVLPTPSPTGGTASPVVSSPPAVQASGPDTWVVISALGTAAAAGGAGISAVIGLLIGVTSLAILGPAMTVLALIVVAAELILHRLAPSVPRPLTAAAGPGPAS